MKKTKLFILICLLFCNGCFSSEFISSDQGSKVYHVDSQKQFDSLKTAAFLPGDTILFKRGMQFDGMFAPSGKGTEHAPIKIDVYGAGERPRIDSGGKGPAGLFLKNPSYWEVNGLEITNTDGSDGDQGALFGIYVLIDSGEGTYRHIYINDC